MKKKLMMLTVLLGLGVASRATLLDEWTMDGDGQYQSSINGVSFPFSDTNKQVFAQTAGDTTFVYSYTNGNAGALSAKNALAGPVDLTAGIVTITLDIPTADFSTNSGSNTRWALAFWDSTKASYVAVGIRDHSNKIKVGIDMNVGGSSSSKALGRLLNGLSGPLTSKIVMEIDYANGELRTSAPQGWDWSANGIDVYTNAVDFAGGGMTNIAYVQIRQGNWTDGDRLTIEDVSITTPEEPTGAYVVSKSASTYGPTFTNVVATFSNVQTGDCVVVLSSANNAALSTNNVTFGGSATLEAPTFAGISASGPMSCLWYAPVSSTGTVFVTATSSNGVYASIGAYLVRAVETNLSPPIVTETGTVDVTAATNHYVFSGAVSNALVLEAGAAYAAFDSTGVDELNVINSLHTRGVGTSSVTGTNVFDSVWSTGTNVTKIALIGLGFETSASGAPSNQQQYDTWAASNALTGADADMTADPDADGFDNLVEYAFGGDPSDVNDAGNVPGNKLLDDAGTNYLQYVHYERDDAATRGLTYVPEVNDDLTTTNWTASGIQFVGSGPSSVAGFLAVTNRIPAAQSEQFLHLKIEFTP